jgi:oligosaccharide reducing-end xylanase
MQRSSSTIPSALLALLVLATACAAPTTPTAQPPTPSEVPPSPTPSVVARPAGGAFYSGEYRNLFAEMMGLEEEEIQARLDAAWDQLFYGNDQTERVYYPVGDDMAYVEDIGHSDVRSEGISYAMMIAVQMDKKEEFDRIWRWAKTYMYNVEGPYEGYFAWHCTTDGEKLHANPASDGEEWMVTALFFASGRWGNGEGILDYRAEALAILDTMLHKSEQDTGIATDMFDADHQQVVFVPTSGQNSSFTDPSYHLPHFYELWAIWAEKDNEFWQEAAAASREFFKSAAHPETGLMPDYAEFDGTPADPFGGGHDAFRFDAWRNGMNVAADYAWFGADDWEIEQSDRLLAFFHDQGISSCANQYTLDGEPLSGDHSLGLVAMNAAAALAATAEESVEFVEELWYASAPTGTWRYYDGLLYMLALLNVSGRFRIYEPQVQ